ncbi:MAG: phenylalanine--tRNA ligase subunit beta [Oscillospiraceae bacterium]|nr:phenylalanine--tRNA ligase subunit beta [Oscillospiraceae bacterium]
MKLPLSWLNDYLKLDNVGVKEYCDALTLSGSKVEGWASEGSEVEGVVFGKILTKVRHTNSDHMWITTVDVGTEVLQIVTGAQNIEVGQIVPVAVNGAKLPGGITIKNGKLRGEASNGMLCSHQELGFEDGVIPGSDPNGILIFQQEYPLGADVMEALGEKETVVEFEITPNRPDCLSIVGLARETAATFDVPFSIPPIEVKAEAGGDINDIAKVTVEAPDLCPRYACRLVKNIKMGPSPEWMQKRLRASGVRPISNIVDITNYVMLEYGQPMHAFDLNFLEGQEIIVRRAISGEEITTLDEQPHTLDDSMLMICDAKKPVCVAGVMGGANSEIKDDTKAVLFECANFLRSGVRQTARKLGLRTESSSRYEKGLDPNMVITALNRACQLVEEMGAGEVVSGIIDVDNSAFAPTVIPFRPEKIRTFIGAEISDEFMISALTRLDIKVDTDKMEVIPPSYRMDIECEADVAEEVARIYGYDKIPSTLVSGETTRGGLDKVQTQTARIKTSLVGQGFYEIQTYSFTSPRTLDMINAGEELRKTINILNPLGEDTSVMRTTTVTGMLEVLARNYNHKNKDARLFEIATVYLAKNLPVTELPEEKKIITLGAYGAVDFYDLKGAVEELMEDMGVSGVTFDTAKPNPIYHPGKSADVYINRKKVGTIGEIHPDVAVNYDIDEAYVGEIELAPVLEAANADVKYKPLSRFPAVTRDIAMLVDDAIKVADIEAVIRRAGGNLLEELELFDVYKGSQIPEGKKSVAFAAVYRGDKTLTDEEINKIVGKTVRSLEHVVGAVLR